jgi:hypothetical protein
MTATLRTEFDAFLYASISEDARGMPLSVLSVLARFDVDPWDEAANLAHLSRESATQRLASILATVPNGPAPGADTETLATRLIALLHRSSGPKVGVPRAPPQVETATQPKRVSPVLYYLAALLFMLFCQWALAIQLPQTPAHTHLPPAGSQGMRAPTAGAGAGTSCSVEIGATRPR